MRQLVAICVVLISLQLVTPAWADGPLPQVPAGFEIEVAVTAPVVERPVMANFDDRGRLYVVDSSGCNLPFKELVKAPPHRIFVLEDTDGDGKFDTRKLFADKLVMPQGVLPYRGAVYVASSPSVWKLEDTDGDGVADKREEIVTKFGSTGNGADVHGPFAGPDGWLYLCEGRHGHKVKLADGTFDEGLASGIFRFRPDGSEFERFCGGGMDNPVEIDFTPEGEILGSVNIILTNPRRDCLVHWMEGGVYPHQEQSVAELRKTGELLGPFADLGHVAVSGVTRYRSSQFGPEYQGNLFSAIFNTHKVVRSVLERSGATFTSREEDFLVSSDPDFRTTDVLEDADGSLLVINTGGWFRIGCPQSGTAKPELLGAIYRVRRKGAKPVADPRGLALKLEEKSPAELVAILDDSRPAVRARVVERLAQSGASAVQELSHVIANGNGKRSVDTRLNAISALSQISLPAAQQALLPALSDKSESVRIAAARAAGMTYNKQAVTLLTGMVVKDVPPARREAATALGRICRKSQQPESNVRAAVLSALAESLRAGVTDRVLEHALIFAIIEIAERDETLVYLKDSNPAVRRAALVALDQMVGGNLTRDLVTPLLDTDDPQLRNTALLIISARKGWASELLTLLSQWLRSEKPDADQLAVLRGVLIAQAGDPQIQRLIGETLAGTQASAAVRVLLWEVVYRAPLTKLPDAWLAQLQTALIEGSLEERRQIIAVLQSRDLPQFDDQLVKIAGDSTLPLDVRIDALVAVGPRLKQVDDGLFSLMRSGLNPEASPLQRLAAARALGEAPLSNPQLLQLAAALHDAGPLAVPTLLRAFSRTHDEQVGLALVAVLNRSSSADNLSPDELGSLLRKYPESVQKRGEALLHRLGGGGLEKQKARLQELAALLDAGDAKRGREVFFGKKAACSGCHAVGNEGGRVGPDLTKIGAIRTGGDLLEAVAFPSATFARDYRPYTILTQAGKVHTGVVTRQTTDMLYLRTAELAEIRIPRSEIDEMRESNVSIMPKGLDATLSSDEFRNLLAFLKSLK